MIEKNCYKSCSNNNIDLFSVPFQLAADSDIIEVYMRVIKVKKRLKKEPKVFLYRKTSVKTVNFIVFDSKELLYKLLQQ